jgi:CheY-like chemotaxis protein
MHLPVVLVVEDEEPLQLVIHDGLKDGGFDVLVVASAREALALLQTGVVSALVTDINVADGYNGCGGILARAAVMATGQLGLSVGWQAHQLESAPLVKLQSGKCGAVEAGQLETTNR